MNKKRFNQIVKNAVRAYRMETGDYDQCMDQAASELDQPDDNSEDTEWDRFCAAVDEGREVPLTDREQKMLSNRKKREEIENARIVAERSRAYYNSLIASKQ